MASVSALIVEVLPKFSLVSQRNGPSTSERTERQRTEKAEGRRQKGRFLVVEGGLLREWAGHDGSGNDGFPGLLAMGAEDGFVPDLVKVGARLSTGFGAGTGTGLGFMKHGKGIYFSAMRAGEVH